MMIDGLIFKHFMGIRIHIPYAGPLRRTVPAIFQTASKVARATATERYYAGSRMWSQAWTWGLPRK